MAQSIESMLLNDITYWKNKVDKINTEIEDTQSRLEDLEFDLKEAEEKLKRNENAHSILTKGGY